jgi:anaerobic magnesium-protoporphyrin IX monomethyl ester cyclase
MVLPTDRFAGPSEIQTLNGRPDPKKHVPIVLISPPDIRLMKFTDDEKLHVDPPLGLVYLAAYLRKHGFKSEILDTNALRFSRRMILDWIKERSPDFVGFTVFTHMANVVAEIAAEIKREMPSIKILVGGPHVHMLYKEYVEEHPQIDFVCTGEGEYTLLQLMEAHQNKQDLRTVKGLCYRENGQTVVTQTQDLIMDLDSLPFPAWDMVQTDHYYGPQALDGESPYTIFLNSRGCPYKCTYCVTPSFWGKQRRRSPQNIGEEIEQASHKLKLRAMRFEDDLFTLVKSWAWAVCDEFIKRKLTHIKWETNGRVSNVDFELLKHMKKAGCVSICMGIEFGSQRVQDMTKRGIKIPKIFEVVSMAKKAGLRVKGYFVIGYPTETEQDILETIKLSKALDLDYAVFSYCTPFPGTPLFNYAKEHNLIQSYDWNDYQFGFTGRRPLKLDTISEEKLVELYNRAVREFYYRPSQVAKILWRHPKFAFNFAGATIRKFVAPRSYPTQKLSPAV